MITTDIARRGLGQRIKLRIKRAMGPWGVFLQGFLEHPVMVGSIIPSSRFTIAKMLAPVKWDECKLFVEYGPGVGTFCRPVLERLARDGTLLVIDTNPLYIDYLRATIGDSRFVPVLGSAANNVYENGTNAEAIFHPFDETRVPIGYLASLFSAGDEAKSRQHVEKRRFHGGRGAGLIVPLESTVDP